MPNQDDTSYDTLPLTHVFDIDRLGEVKEMADRIISMRSELYNLLQELGSKKEWGHIKSQIGMVSSRELTI